MQILICQNLSKLKSLFLVIGLTMCKSMILFAVEGPQKKLKLDDNPNGQANLEEQAHYGIEYKELLYPFLVKINKEYQEYKTKYVYKETSFSDVKANHKKLLDLYISQNKINETTNIKGHIIRFQEFYNQHKIDIHALLLKFESLGLLSLHKKYIGTYVLFIFQDILLIKLFLNILMYKKLLNMQNDNINKEKTRSDMYFIIYRFFHVGLLFINQDEKFSENLIQSIFYKLDQNFPSIVAMLWAKFKNSLSHYRYILSINNAIDNNDYIDLMNKIIRIVPQETISVLFRIHRNFYSTLVNVGGKFELLELQSEKENNDRYVKSTAEIASLITNNEKRTAWIDCVIKFDSLNVDSINGIGRKLKDELLKKGLISEVYSKFIEPEITERIKQYQYDEKININKNDSIRFLRNSTTKNIYMKLIDFFREEGVLHEEKIFHNAKGETEINYFISAPPEVLTDVLAQLFKQHQYFIASKRQNKKQMMLTPHALKLIVKDFFEFGNVNPNAITSSGQSLFESLLELVSKVPHLTPITNLFIEKITALNGFKNFDLNELISNRDLWVDSINFMINNECLDFSEDKINYWKTKNDSVLNMLEKLMMINDGGYKNFESKSLIANLLLESVEKIINQEEINNVREPMNATLALHIVRFLESTFLKTERNEELENRIQHIYYYILLKVEAHFGQIYKASFKSYFSAQPYIRILSDLIFDALDLVCLINYKRKSIEDKQTYEYLLWASALKAIINPNARGNDRKSDMAMFLKLKTLGAHPKSLAYALEKQPSEMFSDEFLDLMKHFDLLSVSDKYKFLHFEKKSEIYNFLLLSKRPLKNENEKEIRLTKDLIYKILSYIAK